MKTIITAHYKKILAITAVLNFLAVLNGMYYFFCIAHFPFTAWLAFNACAPSVFIFLLGCILRDRGIMSAAVPFLFFFGGLGLFFFGWKGTALIAQAGHILMVAAIICTGIAVAAEHRWKRAAAGFCTGLVLFACIVPFQQRYVKSHAEYIRALGDPVFEKNISSAKEQPCFQSGNFQ